MMHLTDVEAEVALANGRIHEIRCEMLRLRIGREYGQRSMFRNPLALLDSALVRLSRGAAARQATRQRRVARTGQGPGRQAPL